MVWLDLTTVPNLIYKGLVNKEQRKVLLSKSTALIQFSLYDEPFGWNVIEANLSGTPVITSNRGAFLDTVKEGVNGYKLSAGSGYLDWQRIFCKISNLSPKDCYDLAIKTYHPNIVIPQYIQFIKNIIADKGSLFV
jgi:glycosyltransferase involved in cell wall biosynthesis